MELLDPFEEESPEGNWVACRGDETDLLVLLRASNSHTQHKKFGGVLLFALKSATLAIKLRCRVGPARYFKEDARRAL